MNQGNFSLGADSEMKFGDVGPNLSSVIRVLVFGFWFFYLVQVTFPIIKQRGQFK